MKKLITIGLLGLFGMAMVGQYSPLMALTSPSSIVLPVDQHGVAMQGVDVMGRKYKVISNTVTETVVCSHSCLLYGIIITSGATTNYVTLRDTATADGSGTVIFSAIYAPGAGKNAQFPPTFGFSAMPIQFSTGLTLKANAADGIEAVVLYKD